MNKLLACVPIQMQQSDGTYYSILGVDEDSTHLQLKQKFQSLVRVLHPDKNTNFDKEQKKRYLEIQNAWKILGDDNTRQLYDEHLKRMRLEQQVLINEEICLSLMEPVVEYDCHDSVAYTYPCRCGGQYNLNQPCLLMNMPQLLLSCENCSLNIKVLVEL